MRRFLFVCMGNICRSPLAEAYARHRFAQLGLEIEVRSAGTIAHHQGEQADAGALAIAELNGLDLSQHRARQITDCDFDDFDLVLGLDERNLRDLRVRCPESRLSSLALLLDFAPNSGHRGVPDPYGESLAVFAHSLSLIRAGVDGLTAHVVAGNQRIGTEQTHER